MNKKNKIDVLSRLTPEMAEVLRIQNEMVDTAFDTTGVSYMELRENYTKERRFWNEGGPSMHRSVDMAVATPHGDVPVRLYDAKNRKISPCIFYIHGGGFVLGNNDTHDRIMRIIADFADCIVIGIDYSLSPEAKFPVAVEQCVAVSQFFRTNAEQYGIDRENIGFAGDSGGANLSMACNLMLRDIEEDTSYIRALLLYYGAYGLSGTGSSKILGGTWDGLSEEDLQFYFSLYIEKEEHHHHPYYNHFEADLTYRMPPCYIVAAELDPLLDDSITLYKVLADKKIECIYKEYQGLIHAFLHHSKILPEAMSAMKEGAEFFKKHIK